MNKFKKIKHFFGLIKINWKTKYRFVIKNDNTHADLFSLLLSPKNVFVVVTTSVFLLILLTTLLIAFTPLRVYVPGYTDPEEYRNFKKIALKVDSVELLLKQNQQYIDNFYSIINDQITPDEQDIATKESEPAAKKKISEKERKKIEEARIEIQEKADMLIKERLGQKNGNKISSPVSKRANINTLLLLPPTIGTVITEYNFSQSHYGIDIKNSRNTLITSVADGIIIFSGFDPKDGNTIIIQHSGNLISVYKYNEILLKDEGYKVKSGEPIAKMGNSGITKKGVHLHFELWYNGFPVNPLDYIVVN